MASVEDVRHYWDAHLNLTQFLPEGGGEPGSAAFWARLEASLDEYAYKAELLRRFAADRPGDALVEIGCGLGVELARLGALGFDVTGVDLSPRAIDLCNDYLVRRGVKGRGVVQNAEQLDFPDACFDAGYSCGVLQHTPDIEKAIWELHRVLKPGAPILIVLYHRHSWFQLLQRVSGANVEFASEEAPIVNSYTRKEMRALFARFRDVSLTTEYARPKPTPRTGAIAKLYNRLFVPAMAALPEAAIRRFGWHLVLTARK